MRRILWFRRDLRITDNTLLGLEGDVLPIFIFDQNILVHLSHDDRRVSYLFDQILTLKKALQSRNLDLQLFWGDPIEIFTHLEKRGFDEVAANIDYDGYARKRDIQISMLLPFRALKDTYIFEPTEVLKSNQEPYLVFTPFYHRAKSLFTPKHLRAIQPQRQSLINSEYESILTLNHHLFKPLPLTIASLGFVTQTPSLPSLPKKLAHLADTLADYSTQRDIPSLEATSDLSLELRFGVLGIRELLRFLAQQKKRGIDTEPYFRQLVFRDFYAYLLYHFPTLENHNYRYAFHGIKDDAKFKLFCSAQTGVPIIDAGVKQLLQTGKMHNRIRMLCASFFTKDLLLPRQWGESFFASHLLDYDAASNILSWQWSAGTGIDPQPYFRIFNPWLQAKKFDPHAEYIKTYLPMLRHLSPKEIHNEASMLTSTISDYPQPIIKHQDAAQKALNYFKKHLSRDEKP